jgi:hypothetical protein
MIRELSESVRRAIDYGSISSAGVMGAVAAITLNQIAVMLTIISLLLNIVWMVFKFLYLRKHGADAMWGAGND